MPVGATLRQARAQRRLTLAQVSEQTKIQPWVLEAMEEDRLQDLMSPVYVKGFLTTYARFLQVAPGPLLAEVPWPALPAQEAEPLPPPSRSLQPLVVRLGLGLAAAAGVAALVMINPLRGLSRAPKPVAKAAAPSKAPAKPKPVARAKRARVPAAAPKAPAAPPGPAAASVSPLSEPLKSARPPQPQTVPVRTLELSLVARGPTWVQVRADGKLLTQQRLARGAQERWSASERFELVIAKPGLVSLSLNGQPIEPFAIAHRGRLLITRRGIGALADASR
jgi:cytoskeletal protein RodZ